LVPECDFGIGGDVFACADDHHVANEGATGVAQTGVADVGCHAPHSGRVEFVILVRVAGFSIGIACFDEVVAREKGAAEAIQVDDLFNQETR